MNALKFVQENLVALVAVIGFIGLGAIFYAGRNDDSRKCVDLITSPNGKYSRTAIGQCFGIIIAIWAPIYTTLQGKLDTVVFATALLYLGGVEMYSIWMRQKQEKADAAMPEGTTTIIKTSTDTTDVSKTVPLLKDPI